MSDDEVTPTPMVEVLYALRFIAARHPENCEQPTTAGLVFAGWHDLYAASEGGEVALTAKGQGMLDRFGFLQPHLYALEES